jgi:hypothetical protein
LLSEKIITLYFSELSQKKNALKYLEESLYRQEQDENNIFCIVPLNDKNLPGDFVERYKEFEFVML